MSDVAEQTQAQAAPAKFPTPAFVRYMVGEGISMTGTWMQGMALG